jgi:hypothetical protein
MKFEMLMTHENHCVVCIPIIIGRQSIGQIIYPKLVKVNGLLRAEKLGKPESVQTFVGYGSSYIFARL